MSVGGHHRVAGFSRTVLALLMVALATLTAAEARDEQMETEIREAFEAGELPGLHSFLAIMDGEIIAEVHVEGADERWGQQMALRQHGPDTVHDLRSVTKSIVSLLYGSRLRTVSSPISTIAWSANSPPMPTWPPILTDARSRFSMPCR